jgi:hypothetical protein
MSEELLGPNEWKQNCCSVVHARRRRTRTCNSPSTSGSPPRDRSTLRNRKSDGLERRRAHERSARICLRDQLGSRAWRVAAVFADTPESIKTNSILNGNGIKSAAFSNTETSEHSVSLVVASLGGAAGSAARIALLFCPTPRKRYIYHGEKVSLDCLAPQNSIVVCHDLASVCGCSPASGVLSPTASSPVKPCFASKLIERLSATGKSFANARSENCVTERFPTGLEYLAADVF